MNNKKITIIGGSGELGSWFGKWFMEHDFDVTLFGRNKERLIKAGKLSGAKISQELNASIKDADYIMVSVPIHDTPEVLAKISSAVKSNAIIFDVASVKYPIISEMEKLESLYQNKFASIHPMFGPGASGLKDKKIIFIEFGSEKNVEVARKLEQILTQDKEDMPNIVYTTASEHDKMISLTLGLPHAFNILYMDILERQGIPINLISQYSGTTFKVQKIISESVIKENSNIYSQIQMKNPIFLEILEKLPLVFEEYYKMISSKDYKKFKDKFEIINRYAQKDDDYQDAYKKFYNFYESINKD
jgi:prephenate dehydrogenase